MLPAVAKRVVLHIGAMKSGTSFIQNVLDGHRAVLADHGVLFAGERWRLQVLAVRELIEHGGKDQPPLPEDGHWQRLVEEINAWPGTAIISMEYLAPRRKQKIELIQEAFDGSDLQVVLTARDLGRSIPSMWIETVQNRGTRTWPEFLEAVKDRSGAVKPGRWFWSHQGIAEISEKWMDAVGRDHFTLITVPPKGSPASLLWDRFCEVADIPTGLCDLDDVRANPGLDAASALVLRALNERLEDQGLHPRDYDRQVKNSLAKRGLVQRGREKVPLGLEEAWVRKASARDLEKLRSLAPRVLGDLDELEAVPVPGVHTDDVTVEQQLEAALDAMAYLITTMASHAGGGGDEDR